MVDALMTFIEIAEEKSTILKVLDLQSKGYYLATVHRPYNTDDPKNLQQIISAFQELDHRVVFSVHPRTRQKLKNVFGSSPTASRNNLVLTDPVGYFDMLLLEKNARMILTDSGGMQKEAFIFHVPCITLRPETEWVETVTSGWNTIANIDREQIFRATQQEAPSNPPETVFGTGSAAQRILQIIKQS